MLEEDKEKEYPNYKLSKSEEKEVEFVYREVEAMIDERNRVHKQFNDRTLLAYIDDSEKRLNGYVPTRESQNKEDWQANVFHPDTRNKLKALIAAVALVPPDSKFRAVSPDGGLDLKRAEVMKELVKHSYYQENPEMEIFFDAWEAAGKGTVIKYEGYLKTKYKRKFIKSYDLATGEVESEEKEVEVDDKCVEIPIPLTELYVKDFHIFDIQKQPALTWIQYLDEDQAEAEFGKYKNWKYVPTKSSRYQDESSTFFYKRWSGRVDENEYEVVRYYNKYKDKYSVVVNGIPLLIAPMIWGRKDKKYPFTKSIFEPFEGRTFFYGNSLPNSLMGQQDVINSLFNMGLDKTYRSMNPPLLAGLVNKDLLELENESVGMESTIYVEDINQVKYQEIPGVTNAEAAMLQLVSRGIDLTTVDVNQQGMQGRGVTAREVVIANESAKRLKGVFFMFLKDLWIQKTKLRVLNILMNYTQPKMVEVVGETGATSLVERFRTFNIEDSEFPSGEKGTLAVQMVGKREEIPTPEELDMEEEVMAAQGEKFQKIVITSDYLDNYDYDIQIIPESIYQKDASEAQALTVEKLQLMATYFPQLFLANQDVLFKDLIKAYNENEDKYNMSPPPMPPGEEEGEGETKGTTPTKRAGGGGGGPMPALPPAR